ncbi:hypothetical protein J3F84DRAFT_389955, partial [Trichoderma pleuroticola]
MYSIRTSWSTALIKASQPVLRYEVRRPAWNVVSFFFLFSPRLPFLLFFFTWGGNSLLLLVFRGGFDLGFPFFFFSLFPSPPIARGPTHQLA